MNLNIPMIKTEKALRLVASGAVAIPALSEDETAILLASARTRQFKWRERITETKVEQNFLGFDEFTPDDVFLKIASATAEYLQNIFGPMVPLPIEFNDYSLQLYPASKPDEKWALSPHKDHKNCIGLIAVYVLEGKAPFYVCSDRQGNNRLDVNANPGDLILMRATGFDHSDIRPFHYVGKVTEERITFGMRQTIDKKHLPRIVQTHITQQKEYQ